MNNRTKISILLIEDDFDDAFLILKQLESINAASLSCDHVSSLQHAKEMLDQNKYEVILSDLNLPDAVSPAQLVQALVQFQPDTPIIILTGHDNDNWALDAIQMGAQDYLVKGRFDSKMLFRVINHSIERSKYQQEKIRLATFPELDPTLIVEIDINSEKLRYANPAAIQTFSIKDDHLPQDIRQTMQFVINRIKKHPEIRHVGTINIHHQTFNAHYFRLNNENVIRIYFIEILIKERSA